ncbi:MAG: gamma-glutamyl-gamma-aminobutyrate hydrolase family protein, partial [Bauldia sp.]
MPLETPTPIILVPADRREILSLPWHGVPEPYLKAVVVGLAGIPLVLPALDGVADFDELLDRVDGVLLSGSRSNVHPSSYGEAPNEKAEPYDTARDAVTLPLIRAAIGKGVPLFAICRGMQELNVALGGTLIAEVHEQAGRSDHRAPPGEDQDARFAVRQDVLVEPGGVLAGILGANRVRVNSLHRQAIGRLADRLAVDARAPDGTIEAVRVVNAPGFA